jgi:hypothetical protein
MNKKEKEIQKATTKKKERKREKENHNKGCLKKKRA